MKYKTIIYFCVSLLTSSMLAMCSKPSGERSIDSSLASITINALTNADYDSINLVITRTDQLETFSSTDQFDKGGQIAKSLKTGTYRFELDYLKGSVKVFSSDFCTDEQQKSEIHTLASGSNPITVTICAVPGAVVQPGSSHGSSGGGGSSSSTFSIKNGKIYDPTGQEFIIRGVSNPHAYYLNKALAALPQIKTLGFNTVRIVWCADTLQVSGRCDAKDMHSIQDLGAIFTQMRQLGLVAVFDLQNATGSDDPSYLDKLVDYLVSSEVKAILQQNQDMTIINIANEWYGSWDNNSIYLSAYQAAITRLRQQGLPHLLMVDSGGYGQEFDSIKKFGSQLVAFDNNLVLSSHFYEVFNSASAVSEAFQFIRSNSLPWVIGEFGCTDGPGKTVACNTIMNEASKAGSSYGYIAWSFAGNSSDLSDLDVASDWFNLSSWGATLVNGESGIAATSKPACFWNPSACH